MYHWCGRMVCARRGGNLMGREKRQEWAWKRQLRCIKAVRVWTAIVVNIWTMRRGLFDWGEQRGTSKAKAVGGPHKYGWACGYVYVWILWPHFNLTRLSVEEWISVHIKLPGIADCEEVFIVCGRRCFWIWKQEGKKGRRETGAGGEERKRWMEMRKRVGQEKSIVLMEAWLTRDKGYRHRMRPWGRRQD